MGILTGILGTAGASSAITGAAGVGSTIASNKANKQIAQMNNEFNERMLDKQINYNKEAYQTQVNDAWRFWNATNEYNAPESQVQRFRDAGLNPYLAIDNAGLASVQSTPSQQGINPPTATPYQADYSGIGQAISNAVGIYNQTKLSNEQAQQLKIENSVLATEKMLQFKEMIARTNDLEFKTWAEKQMFTLEKQLQQANYDEKQIDIAMKQGQLVLQSQQIISGNENLKVLPKQLQLSLAEQTGRIALQVADGKIKGKQLDVMAAQLDGLIHDNNQKAMNQAEQVDTYNIRKQQIKQVLMKTIADTNVFELSKNPAMFVQDFLMNLGNIFAKGVMTMDAYNNNVE